MGDFKPLKPNKPSFNTPSFIPNTTHLSIIIFGGKLKFSLGNY